MVSIPVPQDDIREARMYWKLIELTFIISPNKKWQQSVKNINSIFSLNQL